MKALIIISIIAGVLWLIGMISADLVIDYGEKLKIYARVLFIKIRILPGRKKKARPFFFSAKGYRKRLLKLEEKKRKKELKAEQKTSQKDKHKFKKEGEEKPESGEKKDLLSKVSFITDIVKVLLETFGRHLRIKAARLHITVATGDAAKTAILYGTISQAAAYLFEILNRVTNFTYKKEEFSLTADFLSDKIKSDIHLRFRIRVWHLFAVLIKTGIAYLKAKKGQAPVKKSKDKAAKDINRVENTDKHTEGS